MIYTTLNKIKAERLDVVGTGKLVKHLNKREADDEPISFATLTEVCGIEYALGATGTVPEHEKTWRLFAVWCLRQVQHLMIYEDGPRVVDAVERHVHGEITDAELDTAAASVLSVRSKLGTREDHMALDIRDAVKWAIHKDGPLVAVVAEKVSHALGYEAALDAAWFAQGADLAAIEALARTDARKAQEAKFLEMLHEFDC